MHPTVKMLSVRHLRLSAAGELSRYAASPKVDQSGHCSLIVQPGICARFNGWVNAKVNVIGHVAANLSVLALAEIFRPKWEEVGLIKVEYVRECRVLRNSRSTVWRSWGAIGCVEQHITTRLERTIVRSR